MEFVEDPRLCCLELGCLGPSNHPLFMKSVTVSGLTLQEIEENGMRFFHVDIFKKNESFAIY